MGYPSKESSYSIIRNGTSITKRDGDKLKLLAEQLKSAFASKIDLKETNNLNCNFQKSQSRGVFSKDLIVYLVFISSI